MSVAAMNWALRQRLASPLAQILLYVIADSADPEGVTRYCDPAYMEQHARLTRSTMFRMLGELQERGMLARRKFYTERGDVRYEITLNFEVVTDEPIRRRKKPTDASNSGDDEAETQDEEMNETPESQGETLVDDDHSPTEGQAKSQSDDYQINPSLPKKDSPPTPSGGRSRQELEQEEKRNLLWERFRQNYPGIAAMDQGLAREELDALGINDAEWAVSVLPALKSELAKLRDRPPKNAHLWLRKRLFENFTRAKLDAPPPEGVWIVEGSDEDRALRFVRNQARAALPFVLTRGNTRGYLHKTPVGPDLLAMLVVANQTPLRWPSFAPGTPEFASWQRRFSDWIASPLPLDAATGGIRVPWQWPPSKDGVIYDDGDSQPLAS
jgi:hypothetical protein